MSVSQETEFDRAFASRLLSILDAAPPYALPDALRRHVAKLVGARGCRLLLADYAEHTLEGLDVRTPGASSCTLPIEGSVAGAAYRLQEARTEDDAGGLVVVNVPITIRAERLGVVQVTVPAATPAVVAALQEVAATLAYVIASARRYTDLFERVRRRKDLELAAEMQWELLPVLAYESDHVSLAGALEPAYEIGGDTFDYAVESDTVTLSVTDAVGHGLRAAILSTLSTNAHRNARRRGDSLLGQVKRANDVLHEQFGGESYVTELLVRIDLAERRVVAVNAGHPQPYRLRGGELLRLSPAADLPLGLFLDATYRAQGLELAPGDRLVLVSDGITEATPAEGAEFGEDRLVALLRDAADLTPSEVVRTVTTAVMEHRAGDLADDATVVCLDWRT